MPYQHRILLNRVNRVRLRWKFMVLVRGGARVLLAAIAAFVVAFALDAVVDLHHTLRLVLLVTMITAVFLTTYLEIIRPLLKVPTQSQFARYIEERHPDLDDRLVSAVELGDAEGQRFSSQILEKLIEDTGFHVEPLDLSKTVRARSAAVWGALAFTVSLLLFATIFSNLNLFTLRSSRIFTPWRIPKIDLTPNLRITPGHTRIAKGSSQEIRAELNGFEAEQAVIYFTAGDSTWSKLEMDQTENKEQFVFSFFDVQQQTNYYIKAGDKLSEIYTISVYDAPQISRVDLAYEYPKYTGLKPKREVDSGDVWAPAGTMVKVVAVADKPLSTGVIRLGEDQELRTTITADTLLTASFKVIQDSYYTILISDTDGLSNEPPPEFYIHALPDQPPVLTMEKPGRDVRASMVEEVPIKVRVQDDYGVRTLKLFYTVNGGEDKKLNLHSKRVGGQDEVNVNDVHEFTAEHMMYLEDMGVRPGDFVTYYIEARDKRGPENEPVSSEIYFIDIRSFEQEFYRPMSQGQMGGSRGAGRLSQTQKDIIIATWKLINKKEKQRDEKFEESVIVIIESQEKLKEVTQSTLFQMEQRALFSGDAGDDIGKYYGDAIQDMEQALKELRKRRLKEALTFERESYQNLGRAEAQVTEAQLQRSQAGGPGNVAGLEELAQLFDEELDKLKNKYETQQQNLRRQTDQEVEEALRKVKELARRQQQFNQKVRELAKKRLPPEEKKRRIQELRRQQEQLRRETQELARQTQQKQRQNRDFPRKVQESLRRATSEMTNVSNNLNQENSERAAAKGQQALNRLKQLEDLLERNQNESLRRELQSLEQEFQNLADEQKELTQDLASLSKEQRDYREQLQNSQEQQSKLREEFADAERQVTSLSNRARKARNKGAREFRKFSQDLERARVEDKMEHAKNLLQESKLNSALQASRDIQNMLERSAEKLTRLRSQFAESEEEKLDLALDQTRQLRESLEAAKKGTEERHGTPTPNDSGNKQVASGQDSKQRLQAGPGEARRPEQNLDPRQIDWLNNELADGLRDMELVTRTTQSDTSLSRQAQRIGRNLQNILRTFTGGAPQRFQIIEEQILIPLQSLEAELAQKLELIKNREKLFLARDEKIAPEYKDLVEKYYEALSKIK